MRKKCIYVELKIIEFYGGDIEAIEYCEASRAVGEEDLDPRRSSPQLQVSVEVVVKTKGWTTSTTRS